MQFVEGELAGDIMARADMQMKINVIIYKQIVE